ncbi:MAG: gamma-glutamyl-gamma-aminobutyrate hydrolase family protein [Candidatus Rokubacteria bacterium]|nr:gamma-glutamyl-gamma-aminobutyrate hydrolase family protein [Candidatus Rokubacteria bacterium]
MSRPLIGISTSVTVDRYPERAYVNASYLRAVQGAGGVPVLLPPQLDEGARHALWQRIHGLVLTGGGDIDPARFGETRHATVYEVSAARDALELDLARSALDGEVPLFAICRGIQVLNVVLGGTLVQDIPSEVGTSIVHSQKERRDQRTHSVTVSGETRLADVLGAHDVTVNSFHHQSIRKLGSGLRDVAWAPDGVIEGVELAGAPMLVLGVQWHPEDLVDTDPAAANLFRALVDAASQRTR